MLSDVKARQTKPHAKPYKVTDHGGLYLYVSPTGAKSWRFDYRLHGRRETLTIGRYPDTSLVEARLKHAEARKRVAQGESPAAAKRSTKRTEKRSPNTFQSVANAWYLEKAPHRSTSWRVSNRRWLRQGGLSRYG